MKTAPKNCPHREFQFKPKVTWLSNVQRYILEVAIRCADCGQRFAFQGLPVRAMDLNGGCMTPDGAIGKFSMAPLHAALPPLDDMPIAALPEYPEDGEPEAPAPTDFQVIE